MKTLGLIFSATLLSLSFIADAQKGAQPVRNDRPVSAPVKGYYSIGNNAAKLQSPSNGQVVSNLRTSNKKTASEVKKGYYATGNNNEKLGSQISFEEVKPSGQTNFKARPTKGYYSIGRNADKL